MCYKLHVISYSITQDLKMRDGLKRGMCCKPEVCTTPREYGSPQPLNSEQIGGIRLANCPTRYLFFPMYQNCEGASRKSAGTLTILEHRKEQILVRATCQSNTAYVGVCIGFIVLTPISLMPVKCFIVVDRNCLIPLISDSINATNGVLLCSVYQTPSHWTRLRLMTSVSAMLAFSRMLFILELSCTTMHWCMLSQE